MKGTSALKKINARAKVLKKKHPGKKYRTLHKQATAEYHRGTLGTKYKVSHRVKKVGAVKRKRKAVHHRKKAHKRAAKVTTHYRTRTVTKYKRVGARAGGIGAEGLLAIAAVVGLGILLIKKPSVPSSGDPARDAAITNIVAAARAEGATAAQLQQLVSVLPGATTQDVMTTSQRISSGELHWNVTSGEFD